MEVEEPVLESALSITTVSKTLILIWHPTVVMIEFCWQWIQVVIKDILFTVIQPMEEEEVEDSERE